MSDGILLDLAGRLHRGDRVLPWAPTTTERRGTVSRPPRFIADPPLADVSWRETTMERWERQKERGT